MPCDKFGFSVCSLIFASATNNLQKSRRNKRESDVIENCPLIDVSNGDHRMRILKSSARRCSILISKTFEDVTPLASQVGGLSPHKRRVLQYDPYVLKPLHQDSRGVREVAFYDYLTFNQGTTNATTDNQGWFKSIFGSFGRYLTQQSPPLWSKNQRDLELLSKLNEFVPEYYGIICHDVADGEFHAGRCSLILQDVTSSFSKPCVADIKMGTQSYEPFCTKEKRIRETAKYPEQKLFGFRLVGMRVFDPTHEEADSSGFRVFPKMYGRSLKRREEILQALRIFFSPGVTGKYDTALCGFAVTQVQKELRRIRDWFQDNASLCFYSSSLLFVYEGDPGAEKQQACVKMIDFGHVRLEIGGDIGYEMGLTTLTDTISELFIEEKES